MAFVAQAAGSVTSTRTVTYVTGTVPPTKYVDTFTGEGDGRSDDERGPLMRESAGTTRTPVNYDAFDAPPPPTPLKPGRDAFS